MQLSWLFFFVINTSLVFLWGGERVLGGGPLRPVASGFGLAVLVAAVVARVVRMRMAAARGERGAQGAQVERAFLGLYLVMLAAVLMYFAQSDVFTKLDGAGLDASSPKLAGALAAVWPAVLLAGLLPTWLMELAWVSMDRAPKLELPRVRDAMFSGLGLAAVIIFAVATQYVLGEHDVKKDFSYFRTTRPGEATKKLVQSVDEPLEVTLFFPPANEVADQVESYFEELKAASPKLTVHRYDHALEPAKAKALQANGNGLFVVAKGARHESYYVGVELERARSQLRGLDAEVQKRLLQVARSQRTVYLTQGHGERGEDSFASAAQRSPVEILRSALKAQNYELKTLSAAEGLAKEIPRDAAAVMVLGPQERFSEPEAQALAAYAEKGGKLFLALDPEPGKDFEELLKPLGLSLGTKLLANDVVFAGGTHTPADRTVLVTRSFSSHPAVSTNGRQTLPMFLVGAGPLEELKVHSADLAIDFLVRAEANTFNDQNANFTFDEKSEEKRQAWGLGAAVTRRKSTTTKPEEEMRALVLADSDAVADDVLAQARGNQYFVVDGLKWLVGDEALTGATNSETDSPLMRTAQGDAVIFFGTTFLVPGAVLGLGFTLRRKSKREARPAPAKAKEAKP